MREKERKRMTMVGPWKKKKKKSLILSMGSITFKLFTKKTIQQHYLKTKK